MVYERKSTFSIIVKIPSWIWIQALTEHSVYYLEDSKTEFHIATQLAFVQLCHPGLEKSYNNILNTHFWTKMRENIKDEIRKCEICNGAKSPAQATHVPKSVNRNTSDIEDLCWNWKGNQHLLVVVDIFSKFVFLKPATNSKTNKTTKYFKEELFIEFCLKSRHY